MLTLYSGWSGLWGSDLAVCLNLPLSNFYSLRNCTEIIRGIIMVTYNNMPQEGFEHVTKATAYETWRLRPLGHHGRSDPQFFLSQVLLKKTFDSQFTWTCCKIILKMLEILIFWLISTWFGYQPRNLSWCNSNWREVLLSDWPTRDWFGYQKFLVEYQN